MQNISLSIQLFFIHLSIKFQKLWFKICNFKRINRFKNIEVKLEQSLRQKNFEQAILIQEIQVLIPKKAKKGVSDYIPLTRASRARIKAMVIANFGERMKKCDLSINDQLQIA